MVEKEKCCGCSACYSICPKNCIEMVGDSLGFLYPVIHESSCVQCGLCEMVCPAIHKGNKESTPFAWGGHVRSDELRAKSSSGGMFSLFAESVLSKGGVVFGAALSENCDQVNHIKIESITQLERLRGSKYVQSSICNTYIETKEALESGKEVLFSGTPCQIQGLKLFLRKEYENLLTIEIICHGTPSPNIFKKYIEYMKNKLGSPIKNVFFRDEVGGGTLVMKILAYNGSVYREDKYTDFYYRLFLSNTCLRESCYNCPSRGLYTRADITLGDFWGVENVAPDLIDGKGLSLVVVHTSKGKQLFDSLLDKCVGHDVGFEKAIQGNPAFFESYQRPSQRSTIGDNINKLKFEKLVSRYTESKKEKIIIILKRLHLYKALKSIKTIFSNS